MKYFVKQMILGTTKILPIESAYFCKLQQSRNALVAAKAIEEKYDLLISNYLEFEKEILVQIAEQVIFSKESYDDSYAIKTVMNRRIVNLLTSTKLYYDQMERKIRDCDFNKGNFVEETLSYFSREYDEHFHYRFMENLRNYVQHCGLAIHWVSLSSRLEGEGDSMQMRDGIGIFSTVEELGQDPKFSQRPVFKECPERINLVKAIRKYIERLSFVHSDIRTLINKNLLESRSNIEEVISKYKDINNNDALGIYAYGVASYDPQGHVEIKIPLLLDWDNVRINLITKNKTLINNSKRYITGSCL